MTDSGNAAICSFSKSKQVLEAISKQRIVISQVSHSRPSLDAFTTEKKKKKRTDRQAGMQAGREKKYLRRNMLTFPELRAALIRAEL